MRNKQNDKDYPNKMDSLYLCITTYIHNYCIQNYFLEFLRINQRTKEM